MGVLPQEILEAEPQRLGRRRPDDGEVDVRREAVLWILQADEAGDEEAPIAALRHCTKHQLLGAQWIRLARRHGLRSSGASYPTVVVVAELKHDLVHALGVLGKGESSLPDLLGEAEVGQRRRDEVKGLLSLARLREQRQDLGGFQEAARP